ncbi:MAG TPA: ATP-binding protein [Burkholderiales bacterium]|nr:ATP-binding protein [Burkholderiales bacterium]
MPALKSVLPREAPIEANSALALLLAAGALWQVGGAYTAARRSAQVMAGAVLLLGLATLSQSVFDVDFGIDELLFRDFSALPGSAPGRMSPYSAIAFVGIGLALSAFSATSLRPLVWTAAALTAFIGAVPIAGYLTNASVVISNRWLSPLASTIAFVLLGIGTIVASAPSIDRIRPLVRTSVEKKVIAAFVGALLLLFVGAGFTYRASLDFAESARGITRGEQLREALTSLSLVLSGAESAQTAYLLTSRENQRDEYERLVANATAQLQVVRNYLTGDASLADDLAQLTAHVERRLELLREITTLFDEAGLSSAKEAVASDEGARKMQAISAVTARIDERSEKLLLQRENTLARTRQLSFGSLLFTLAVAAGIFLALFRGISREMKARTDAEQALREVNREVLALNSALENRAAEVEGANKELEAFSYSVSHDLRVPLRHIDGYIEMLIDESRDALPEKARGQLDVIADSSRRMSALIDDLLAFSRIGRADLSMVRVDVAALVREVIADLEMATRGRRIEWRIGALGSVVGDISLLRQAFANLIDNAIKYTQPREVARIEIGASGHEDGRRIFFIQDNGVGFNMEQAGKLFGIFQRLHRAQEFEGTGVGLANVHRIVTRHDGRVWAEAQPDRGATFYVSLKPYETPA